jgi:hypothetical protein
MKTAIAISVICFTIVLTATFVYNFQNFCKNPNGSGNWIVQPFCEK